MKTSEANALDNNPIWQAFKRGEEIQYVTSSSFGPVPDLSPETLLLYPEQYRIKPQEFPAPPEGRSWHNPMNLTPEQVGVKDGWRLFLAGEKQREGYQFWHYAAFNVGSSYGWSVEDCNRNTTVRTKASLPIECPFKVGDTIQRKEFGMEHCIYTISDIRDGYVHYNGEGLDPFSAMDLYKLYIPEYTIQAAIVEARTRGLYLRPVSYRGTGFFFSISGGALYFAGNLKTLSVSEIQEKWEVVGSGVIEEERQLEEL